jgi:hypothetical protein
MIAEVPETLASGCELFSGCGYVRKAILTDYVLETGVQEKDVREIVAA